MFTNSVFASNSYFGFREYQGENYIGFTMIVTYFVFVLRCYHFQIKRMCQEFHIPIQIGNFTHMLSLVLGYSGNCPVVFCRKWQKKTIQNRTLTARNPVGDSRWQIPTEELNFLHYLQLFNNLDNCNFHRFYFNVFYKDVVLQYY